MNNDEIHNEKTLKEAVRASVYRTDSCIVCRETYIILQVMLKYEKGIFLYR